MAKLSMPRILLPSKQSKRRLIESFAERSGMVYFGYVSQRNDEHHIVRGLTVSTQHVDDHYCIGTHQDYDVIFVERSDTLRSGKRHCWHIIEIDLKTSVDVPHIFIGSATKGPGFHELLALKYPSLLPLTPGVSGAEYPDAYKERFGMYVTPAHAVVAEQLITTSVAHKLVDHFGGLVIELQGQSMFVYSEHSTLSATLLDTMLSNAVWLAGAIDENSRR